MAFLIAWSISSAVMRTIILLVTKPLSFATTDRAAAEILSGNVSNYVEVGIAKREVERLQFSSHAFNHLCDVGAAPRSALACKTPESICSVTPFSEIFWHNLDPCFGNSILRHFAQSSSASRQFRILSIAPAAWRYSPQSAAPRRQPHSWRHHKGTKPHEWMIWILNAVK